MSSMPQRIRHAVIVGLLSAPAFAGPLSPPVGPVSPTNKTLAEVEPRTAINATNTPGDANSLFQISQPGSYYLTDNIQGQAGMHGIEIASSNVTIDLNGFTLAGGPGSLDGIATQALRLNITIRNGIVYAWGEDGIDITEGAVLSRPVLLEGIIAVANGGRGISVGRYATIRDCVATNNVSHGVVAIRNALIESTQSHMNGGSGFEFGESSVIRNCTANDNDMYGINATAFSVVSHCTVEDNGLDGIRGVGGTRVTESVARRNGGNGILIVQGSSVEGCTAEDNDFAGIFAEGPCLVRGNNVGLNTVAGIRVFNADSRIEDNNASGNATGYLIQVAGNFLARNTASGNTTANWNVVAGNACFVVNATNAGAINGNSGGVSPGSTNPNANYTY